MGVSIPEIARITKRRDFVAVKNVARAHKMLAHGRSFVLQGAPRKAQVTSQKIKKSLDPINRFGFTVTKRVGNSVVRNRIRRRMREAVRLHAGKILVKHSLKAHDFVMIAREEALHIPFQQMIAELTSGLDVIAKKSTQQQRNLS
jgi:ribonuclease P protein component